MSKIYQPPGLPSVNHRKKIFGYLATFLHSSQLFPKALIGLFFLCALIGFNQQATAQTTLAAGDVALVGINSANPDKFSIVLLKSITTGTIINFTDNGFTGSNTTGRTGEGFLTYTAPGNRAAGTILTWTNGVTTPGFSSSAPTNFAFNASGDQLFIFQGNTANWATQSGINLLFGINYGIALSGTSGAANTLQPSTTLLAASAWLNLPTSTYANGYFANGSTATSSVTFTGTAAAALAATVDAAKWVGTSGTAATFPSYIFVIGTDCTAPSLSAIQTNVSCFGGSTGAIDLTTNGGTSPFGYAWTRAGGGFFASTQDLTGITAGTYNVTVVTPGGCTVSGSYVVGQPAAALEAASTAGTIACNGGTTTVTVSATGGTAPYTGTGTFTVPAGSYSYTVTDANGCTSVTVGSVTEPTALSAAATTENSTCGNANGSITMTVTGGTPNYEFAIVGPNGYSSDNSNGVFLELFSGAYTVTAFDGNNCTAVVNITVNNTAGPSASATTTNASCGNSNGSVELTVTGGTAPFSYAWSNAASTEDLTGLTAGTYTVTVTDANGCTTTASATVGSDADLILPTITAPAAVSTCTNTGCTASGVNLGSPVTADNCSVASVTNNAPAVFPLGITTVTWTVTDAAGNTATTTQTVTVTDGTAPSIYVNQTGLLPGVTGPSSSAPPYVLPLLPGIKFTSILSVGDNIGGYQMAGIPDGLGAFDNCDGTFTLLMNHEIGNTLGGVRAHGGIGAFVSKWIINKSTLQVQSGSDLMQQVYFWNNGAQTNNAAPTSGFAFSRFCSADLPAVSAYYNAATGKGSQARIFMHGEEGGINGYQLGTVASGPDAGKAYILGKFNLSTNGSGLTGVGAWENALANPFAQDTTIVIGNNDGGTGIMNNSVSVYIGTKQTTGSEVDKAGLNNGKLLFVTVAGNAVEITNNTTRTTGITNGTAFTLSETSSTTFSRPEDGVWNPLNPAQYFFVTTDRLDQVNDGIGTQIGRSRLWRLNFTDITKPSLGGTIDLLLNGTEGYTMFDNLTADKAGNLILQEDVGNAPHNCKIWQYNVASGNLVQIAKHDAARFGDIVAGASVPATAPFTQDEETSGVIDVSDILGGGMYLLVDQAHYALPSPLVEGGQLLAFFNPASIGATGTAQDTVRVTVPFGSTTATVNLGVPAAADNCSLATVTNDAPAIFPVDTTTVTWTAADAAGNTATATQVVIVTQTVNAAPSVTITSPVSPAGFDAGDAITVNVSATDADGSVKKVEIFVNGALFATDSVAPYTFSGANVEAGVYKVTAKATDNVGLTNETDTLILTVTNCSGSGSITGEGFTNIPGTTVSSLVSNNAYPGFPTITASLGSFEYQNVADDYGGRVRGYICAPVTGNYRFWIAADEQAFLYLSTDKNPQHVQQLAFTLAPTGFRQWAKFSSQISAPVRLTKGVRYYIETLHKEASGADHLSVAWQLPNGTFEGPIPGSRLSPFTTPAPLAGRVTGARAFAAAMVSNTLAKAFEVTATPNPSTSRFTLSVKSNSSKTVSVKVFDASGRLMETKLNAAANSTMQIGSKLIPGIYFVEVVQDNQKQRLKLVKQ